MEPTLLELQRAADRAPATPIDEPLVGVVRDEGANLEICLFQHDDVPSAMADDIAHAGRVSAQGADPLFWEYGVLGFFCFEELAQRVEPIIAELKTVLTDFP